MIERVKIYCACSERANTKKRYALLPSKHSDTSNGISVNCLYICRYRLRGVCSEGRGSVEKSRRTHTQLTPESCLAVYRGDISNGPLCEYSLVKFPEPLLSRTLPTVVRSVFLLCVQKQYLHSMSAYRTRITVAVAMVAIPTMTPTVCLELKLSDDVSVVPPMV